MLNVVDVIAFFPLDLLPAESEQAWYLSSSDGTSFGSSCRLPSSNEAAKAFLLLVGWELYSLLDTSKFLLRPLFLNLIIDSQSETWPPSTAKAPMPQPVVSANMEVGSWKLLGAVTC